LQSCWWSNLNIIFIFTVMPENIQRI